MADWFIDHENTTWYKTAYMATPSTVADLPQEGDGTVNGLAATPTYATATWDLTSASASSGTMTIMGASITGLTASGSALATAIASAINASTAAVTTADGNITNPYLKAVCWATSSGATLNVYTRIASARLNSSYNAANKMAVGTGWTTPPADANFTGGVSGPWRYWFNTSALASAVAAGNAATIGLYGGFVATVMGSVASGDKIYHRTSRSGSDVIVTLSTTATTTVVSRVGGSQTAPLYWLFDAGVKWPGDSGVFRVVKNFSVNFSKSITLNNSSTTQKQIFAGVALSENNYNFRIEYVGTNTSNFVNTFGVSGSGQAETTAEFHNLAFTGASGGQMLNVNSAQTNAIQFLSSYAATATRQCPATIWNNIYVRTSAPTSHFIPAAGSANYASWNRFNNLVVDFNGLTTAATNVLGTFYGSGTMAYVEFNNCKFLNLPALTNLSGMSTPFSAGYELLVSFNNLYAPNLRFFGGTSVGGCVGATEGSQFGSGIVCSNTIGLRTFVAENAQSSFAWSDSTQPRTTSSYLLDGINAFSIRCSVTAESGKVTKFRFVKFPPIRIVNSQADGSRTVTLKLLIDSNYATQLGHTPTNDEIWMEVDYVDTSGNGKLITTHPGYFTAASNLTAGNGGDWSSTSYDVNGVGHTYSPFVITASLPNLKSGTEVRLSLVVGCQTNSVDNLIIIDPNFGIA